MLTCCVIPRLVREYWSRREELNAPWADYCSAALPLSYTGLRKLLS